MVLLEVLCEVLVMNEGSSTVNDLLRKASILSSISLDLSRKGIEEFPGDFPLLPSLEVLAMVIFMQINCLSSTLSD